MSRRNFKLFVQTPIVILGSIVILFSLVAGAMQLVAMNTGIAGLSIGGSSEETAKMITFAWGIDFRNQAITVDSPIALPQLEMVVGTSSPESETFGMVWYATAFSTYQARFYLTKGWLFLKPQLDVHCYTYYVGMEEQPKLNECWKYSHQ